MKERLYALDFLRTFMMLLGIVIHAIEIFEPVIPFLTKVNSGKFFSFLIDWVVSFRMPLFYLLSGYFSLLLYRKYGLRNFMVDRTKRIIIPFLVSVVTKGVVCHFLFWVIYSNEQFSGILNFVYNLTPIHLWFIYYLSIYIPLIILLSLLIKKIVTRFPINEQIKGFWNNNWFFLTVIAIFFSTFSLFFDKGKLPNATFRISFFYLIYYFVFYVFGWLMYKYSLNLDSLKKFAGPLLLIAFTLSVFQGKIFEIDSFTLKAFISCLVTTFYIVGFIGLAQTYFNRKSAIYTYMSESSYWVYLIHFPILLIIKLFFIKSHSLSIFLTLLVATIALSILTYHYFVRGTVLGKYLNGKKQATIDAPLELFKWWKQNQLFRRLLPAKQEY